MTITPAGSTGESAFILRQAIDGQIAAREMEIVRIKGALQKAEELRDDVAAAIERTI